MQTISDDVLIDKLRSNDSVSYELLYKSCFPPILNYIKQNSGNMEDAEDVFQESIIVLAQKVHQPGFLLTSSLKTYLFAVSRNLWLKRLRNNRRIVIDYEVTFDTAKHETGANLIEFEPEKTDEEKVHNWLQRISEHCQHILKAIFFYQEPMEDLMRKMGWKNKHSASNQKYKCIEQVKKVSKIKVGA